jgi:predicted Rossmann fold nucleotide-binding protein DprA/Smf involved in DNA uptake
MKVAIVGSREYPNLSKVRAYIITLPIDTVIVSGGARGGG